jgi:hypothetical protein
VDRTGQLIVEHTGRQNEALGYVGNDMDHLVCPHGALVRYRQMDKPITEPWLVKKEG